MHKILFVRNHEDAVIPTRGTELSVGYDLTCIKVHKNLGMTTLYDTGISVKPPPGYYTEIVPRSSISKTGYILANGVGIIDEDYRGNLLVALTKIDDKKEDLKLPFVACQLLLKKAEYCNLEEVQNLDETERGAGGFGSTRDLNGTKR
jgi:dUTP pyrophosphatase